MRIVKLASLHVPFDTRIFEKEALSLAEHGHHVTIIVPADSPVNDDKVEFLTVKKRSSGLKRLLIVRWQIFFKALRQPADSIFHIHDSELLLMGILLRLSGRRVIYDAHEDTPLQLGYQHWIPRQLKKPYILYYKLLEKIANHIFNRIIIAEPVIGKYFSKRKTTLIRNFPRLNRFADMSNDNYLEREPSICYIGLISKVRGAYVMKQAYEKAGQSRSVKFYLGGKFAPPALKEKILDGQSKITFLSWLSFDQILYYLSISRIGLILPEPIERYKTNYPVKLFEYMAAGIPVVASKYGESSRFVQEANCGVIVDPADSNEAAKAIEWLLDNPEKAKEMGDRGRDCVFKNYNWELEEQKLLAVYENIK